MQAWVIESNSATADLEGPNLKMGFAQLGCLGTRRGGECNGEAPTSERLQDMNEGGQPEGSVG